MEVIKTCGDSGGRKKDGDPCACQLGLSEDNGLCGFHDPARADAIREIRSAGGKANSRIARARRAGLPADLPRGTPKSLADAVKWSSWAIRAVAVNEIDARTGHEIGYLLSQFKGALEKTELVRQIEELKAQLAERKQGGARRTRSESVASA